jgi:ABC-type dipeptide/oligopeptide/nickel transport system ATPase component
MLQAECRDPKIICGNGLAIPHEGQIVETGSPEQIFGSPLHEYTQKLVAALPLNPLCSSGEPGSAELVEAVFSGDAHP